MRAFSKEELGLTKHLVNRSIELTYIEPTVTGLSKSIMDATHIVRDYFEHTGYHDYTRQLQGTSHKHLRPAVIYHGNEMIGTKVSLYRPMTKNGDPRIWIYALNKYCQSGDIIGLIVFNHKLHVFNFTTVSKLVEYENIPFSLDKLFTSVSRSNTKVSQELLQRLKEIHNLGFVKTVTSGDTGVGATLESLLGIEINSSKKPDYKGIELKTKRYRSSTRDNLFTQVANWKLSILKSSRDVLEEFGYSRDGVFRLYCTVKVRKRNPQGLKLITNSEDELLIENSDRIGDFLFWEYEKLHERLQEKHNETFWIEAKTKKIKNIEHFNYSKVVHTKEPSLTQFNLLLEAGEITVDHLIQRKANGEVKEKGPSFKLNPKFFDQLFPQPVEYSLASM